MFPRSDSCIFTIENNPFNISFKDYGILKIMKVLKDLYSRYRNSFKVLYDL